MLWSKVADLLSNIFKSANGQQTDNNVGGMQLPSNVDLGKVFQAFTHGFGSTLNDLTGATAANEFSAEQAALSREHATAEREAAQDFSSREAQISRDWQEYYDSTAMQRRMADYEAAGLNPMAVMGASNLGTSSGSTAAASSAGSSSSASASGNSSSALSGLIRAVATVVKAAK